MGIAIRHSRGYVISVLQGQEMAWMVWTPGEDRVHVYACVQNQRTPSDSKSKSMKVMILNRKSHKSMVAFLRSPETKHRFPTGATCRSRVDQN